jgi:hypothetical protein
VFVGGDVFVFPGDCEVSVSGGTTSADCSQWCLPELMSNASYDAGASTSGVFVIARQNDIVTIVTNVAGQAQQLVAPLVGPIEVSLYTFGAFSVNVRSIVVTVPPGQDAGFISDTFQCNSL